MCYGGLFLLRRDQVVMGRSSTMHPWQDSILDQTVDARRMVAFVCHDTD